MAAYRLNDYELQEDYRNIQDLNVLEDIINQDNPISILI